MNELWSMRYVAYNEDWNVEIVCFKDSSGEWYFTVEQFDLNPDHKCKTFGIGGKIEHGYKRVSNVLKTATRYMHEHYPEPQA